MDNGSNQIRTPTAYFQYRTNSSCVKIAFLQVVSSLQHLCVDLQSYDGMWIAPIGQVAESGMISNGVFHTRKLLSNQEIQAFRFPKSQFGT